MLRWLSVGQIRRSCLYSPRKCFALLVGTALMASLVLMWNQTVSPGKRQPAVRVKPPALLIPPLQAGNLSLYPTYLLPSNFVFRIQPRTGACGDEGTRTLQYRDRFEELLEARPDGEEPPVPPVVLSYGVIFVPVLVGETEVRQAIRRTWGSGGWQRNSRARVIFVCGSQVKSETALQNEAHRYGDILQIDLTEDDSLRPKRLPGGLAWIEQTCSRSMPTFVAKSDPSLFINRDSIIHQVDTLPTGLHGQLTAPSSLSSNFYLIKGSEAIENILVSLTRVKYQPLEDIFITEVIGEVAGLNRFDLPGFDGGNWRRAGGCWLTRQTVISDLVVRDYEGLWLAMTDRARLECRRGEGCCEDGWGLGVVLAVILGLVLLLHLSIVHTYFWSSLVLFCADICNTVDSGMDDDEDSDFGGDDERVEYEGVVIPERGEAGFLFDIHRSPVDRGAVERF